MNKWWTVRGDSSGVNMSLTDYSSRAALTAVDLVNSYDVAADRDHLISGEVLAGLLSRRGWVVDRPLAVRDLERLRTLRARLRLAFGAAPVRKSVDDLNALLRDFGSLPQLTGHDG